MMDDVRHLSCQVDNLARAVNDIREKLGDIPIIKAAVLQALRFHAAKQGAPAPLEVSKPQMTERSTQTFSISVVRKGEINNINYSPINRNINGIRPTVTVPNTKDAATSPMLLSPVKSCVGTQTGRKANVHLESDEERILLFNIHTLFGKSAVEKFFIEMDKKYLASQITKYRVDNNISILDQMQLRTKLLSIVNFDKKIIEYAREQTLDRQTRRRSDEESESNCQTIDETTEDFYHVEDTACSSNADENSRDQLKRGHKKRSDRIERYDDKWYILKLPNVVECMKNENFIDEILSLYFDEESYDSKPYKMLRIRLRKTGKDRLCLPKRMRRGNYTEEELETMQKMVEEKISYQEIAHRFNTNVPCLKSTLKRFARSRPVNVTDAKKIKQEDDY